MAKKTLIQIAQAVAAECNLPMPQAVVSSTDTRTLQILNLIRGVCDDLLQEFDWQALIVRATTTMIAGQEAYDEPADLKRYVSTTFFENGKRWPMRGPLRPVEWETLLVNSIGRPPCTAFRRMGGSIHLFPVPTSGASSFSYEYVSSYYVKNGASTKQADFTQDSDICLFDHRLVVYGAKLKFLASAGLDTTVALADYNGALLAEKTNDEPGRRLSLSCSGDGVPLLSTLNIPDSGFGS